MKEATIVILLFIILSILYSRTSNIDVNDIFVNMSLIFIIFKIILSENEKNSERD